MRRTSLLLALVLSTCLGLVAPSVAAKPHHHAPKPVKHGYVVDRVLLPVSSTQATQYGVDLNGDGKVDNRFGTLLAALGSQGFDVQGTLDSAMSSGALVTLLSIETKTKNMKNAKKVRVRLFRGLPGTTTVDGSAPSTELKAKIVKKVLVPKPGTVHLAFPALLPGRPSITFDLVQGRILGTCKANGCTNGRLVGGIPSVELDQLLVPEIGAALRAVVARDCPTTPPDPCTSGTPGAQLLSLFDANHDGTISDDEVRGNAIIKGLLAPDVDLIGGDGVADSLSVGVAFTAHGADVTGD